MSNRVKMTIHRPDSLITLTVLNVMVNLALALMGAGIACLASGGVGVALIVGGVALFVGTVMDIHSLGRRS